MIQRAILFTFAAALILPAKALSEKQPTDLPSLVECAHAFAVTTFNMLPTETSNQGVFTEFLNAPVEYPNHLITLFVGTEKNSAVIQVTRHDLYLNENLKLFDHQDSQDRKTYLTAMTSAGIPTAKPRLNPLYMVVKFESYPFLSYGYSHIGDEGRMYGYPTDKITSIDESMRLTDPQKMKSAIANVEYHLKTGMENLARALIRRAKQRSGIWMRSSAPWAHDPHDLDKNVAENLRLAACKCKQVRGLEKIDRYLEEKLVSLPGQPPKDFRAILIRENLLANLVFGKAAEIRPLDSRDLSCDMM